MPEGIGGLPKDDDSQPMPFYSLLVNIPFWALLYHPTFLCSVFSSVENWERPKTVSEMRALLLWLCPDVCRNASGR